LSASESEERAQFTLAMRAKGIEDLDLLRALERVPRALFMPQRFADISGRDIALPIGCGQTSPPPSTVASMVAALDLNPSDAVCEIGTGSGYCTALLAQFAKEVVSLERFQALAVEAQARVKAFGLEHVEIAWADGFEACARGRKYDKVIAHGVISPPVKSFLDLLAPHGALVAALAGQGSEQRIVRLTLGADGPAQMTDMGKARALRPLERGLSRAL